MELFISYTQRDAVLTMKNLYQIDDMMRCLGNPYIDIIHNNSSNRQAHVLSMLQQANILCAYVTPLFFESEWVRLELNLAALLGTPIIFLNHQSMFKKDALDVHTTYPLFHSVFIPPTTLQVLDKNKLLPTLRSFFVTSACEAESYC